MKKKFDIFKVEENGKTLTVKSYIKPTTLNSIGIRIRSGDVYYYRGKIHRELGPAVDCMSKIPFGDVSNLKIWVKNGKIHNDFGPAYKTNNIIKWYINGKLHRINGPALVVMDKLEDYYINGKKLPTEEAKLNTDRLNKLNSILNSPIESPFEMLKNSL